MKRLIVAAVAVLALAGCTSSTSGSGNTATSGAASSAPRTLTGSPIPASSTATPPSTPPSSGPPTSVAPLPRSGPLNGFLVADLTFVGSQGWALGTVGCTQASGRCTAIAHTTDNGRTWRSIKPPAVHVLLPEFDSGDCAAPCVSSVRFATPAVGYLFGGADSGALLTTTDGGAHWKTQAGNADALESLDGNVIRVSDKGGCPPGCAYVTQVSAIGSTAWTTVPHGGFSTTSTGVTLARTGSRAYLLQIGHPAGGGNNARSTLWTSSDDGHHWRNRGEPCPPGKNEVDSLALTTAPDGAAVVLCQDRFTQKKFVAVSTDGGAHFAAGAKKALGAATAVIGAGSASDILASSDDTYRSTDGGHHFSRLGGNGGSSPGALGWLGFASSTVAHAISVDRRTIWLTTDGGTTWHAGKLR